MSIAKNSFLKCNPSCGHSNLEHKAFDQGLKDGERGMFQCPIIDKRLKQHWLNGNSVGALNYYTGPKCRKKSPSSPITYMTDEFMAKIFNLWLKRFQENPNEFGEITNASDDYGSRCVAYFNHLAGELKP